MRTPTKLTFTAAGAAAIATAVVLVGRPLLTADDTAPGGAAPPAATSSAPAPAPPEAPSVSSSVPSAATSARLAPAPALTEDDQQDPDLVAQRVVQTLHEFDTATDDDRAAARRAGPLLATALAADLAESSPDGPDGNWQVWQATTAWGTVETYLLDVPQTAADTRTTAMRTVGYLRTVHTDGTSITEPQRVVLVALSRAIDTDPWRVTAIQERA